MYLDSASGVAVAGSEGRLRPRRLSDDVIWHCGLILFSALVIVLLNPRGYLGGGWDDGRYLAAATQWADQGPVVGTNHWALRWPLILPVAGLWKLFGPSRIVLMLPGIAAWVGLALVNYLGLRRAINSRAALLAGMAIIATPGFVYWAPAIYPDTLEALFWSVALWSTWFAARSRKDALQCRWMLLAGVAVALSVGLRETVVTLLLAMTLVMWRVKAIQPRAWMMCALAALPLPLIEHLSYWMATGDPIYRLHVDMRHITIASSDMRGGVALGMNAPFNPELMERWYGSGPVRLHWLVDPYINLFAHIHYGYSFVAAALLGAVARWKRLPVLGTDRQLVLWLLVIAALNILVNTYALALKPGPRMFVVATVAASLIAAILADRLWSGFWRVVTIVILLARLITSMVVSDVAPNFASADKLAEQMGPKGVSLHVDWNTHAHLALARPALRERMVLKPALPGEYQLIVAVSSDKTRNRPPHGRWREVAARKTGHIPWSVRIFVPLFQQVGLMRNLVYREVEVRLLQRLPD